MTKNVIEKVTNKEDKTKNVTEKVTDKKNNLSNVEKDIVKLLSENPFFTTISLANQLHIHRKTVSLKLKSLKDKGIIERVGSDRKGYWKLK